MRPSVEIALTAEERGALERLAQGHGDRRDLPKRARIVLLAAKGLNNVRIGRELGITDQTARKWRNRFAERRLDGIEDAPRPGRPRSIDDDAVAEVVRKTLEETPRDAARWTARSMARATGYAPSTIHRIWRAFSLKPGRGEAGLPDRMGPSTMRSPVPAALAARPCEVLRPDRQTAPLVLASPHSGADYPPGFVAQSPLSALDLRRSEDCFVDELFRSAPALGAPLLHARFPRAFVDPNREPYELDPEMFEDALPAHVNTGSSRVAAGLGTIARVVSGGREIHGRKLRYAEALARIEACYRPYHAALAGLIDETRRGFGRCLLLDCHSMPSVGGPMDPDAGRGRADFILGDGLGTTCDGAIVAEAEAVLARQGYRVTRNKPFSGGYITRHYGRPERGVHALQIEINRALYMDEERITRLDSLSETAERMTVLLRAMTALGDGKLAAE